MTWKRRRLLHNCDAMDAHKAKAAEMDGCFSLRPVRNGSNGPTLGSPSLGISTGTSSVLDQRLRPQPDAAEGHHGRSSEPPATSADLSLVPYGAPDGYCAASDSADCPELWRMPSSCNVVAAMRTPPRRFRRCWTTSAVAISGPHLLHLLPPNPPRLTAGEGLYLIIPYRI
ncbi:hypothetical protein Taro_044034 [Colocasia esculenta]|uniref:Uncharacterized protein n=1 Tax=Colocasia esculenta TaxID=4460 RepID=A0A843X006_COLES|nr:hypothetical protein [Colocasia esculenta]